MWVTVYLLFNRWNGSRKKNTDRKIALMMIKSEKRTPSSSHSVSCLRSTHTLTTFTSCTFVIKHTVSHSIFNMLLYFILVQHHIKNIAQVYRQCAILNYCLGHVWRLLWFSPLFLSLWGEKKIKHTKNKIKIRTQDVVLWQPYTHSQWLY